MRKSWMAAAAVGLLAAAPVSAATLTISPQPDATQTLRQANGKPALQSQAPGSTVALVVQSDRLDAASSPVFLLALGNTGANPVTLTAENVTAQAHGRTLRLYTVEDLKQAANDRLLIAQSYVTAADRPGFLGASPRTGYVQRPGGGGFLVDPNPPTGSKKEILAEADVRIAAAKKALADADTFGFKPVTMAPGANAWTGLTLGALPKGATSLQVTIRLANEIHTFAFALNRTP